MINIKIKKMKHIIFTRFIYDEGSKADKRLEIMKETLIKCLHAQTNQNFVWSLMCKEHHRKTIEEMYGKEVLFWGGSEGFKKFVKENNYEIQTRHDSDDIMCPEYVQLLQNEFESNKFRKEPFLIEFQPMFHSFGSNHFHEFTLDYAKRGSTSAFITLCPQNTGQTIWDHTHTAWASKIKTIIRHKNRKCVAATVHGSNTTTGNSYRGKKII